MSALHRLKFLACLGLVSASVIFVANRSDAADISVTSAADAGAGTLREAMTNAASGDRIVFDIPVMSTITLASDLPAVAGDVSFDNINAAVAIDRNGFAALSLNGSQVDPTNLVINTGGAASPDADIIAGGGSTVFGAGALSGNLEVPNVLAPGATSTAGDVGTLAITGNLNMANATGQFDVSATTTGLANDQVTVTGTTDVSGATLAPNFIGDRFAPTQQFLLIDGSSPIVGMFANQAETFTITGSDFLEAVVDGTLAADDFGLVIQDNGTTFASTVTGCNHLAAAAIMDDLRVSAPGSDAVIGLLNGTTSEAAAAIGQVTGSIYPSLIGAEIFHVQNSIESIRDRIALQRFGSSSSHGFMPWVRPYGISGQVDPDDCETHGYRHEVGGLELGASFDRGGTFTSHIFGTLATADISLRAVDQDADVDSYRIGGALQYHGAMIYVIAAGGAGNQDYEVTRSLDAISGSTAAMSAFDGSTAFGYVELGSSVNQYFTPFISLHGTTVDLDAATETGDATFALAVPEINGESLRSVLGLSVQKSSHVATTRMRFGWLHEYLDEAQSIVTPTAGGATLTSLGVKPGIDWAFVRAQIDMGAFLGGNFSVAYQGQFNSRSSYNLLVGGLNWVY